MKRFVFMPAGLDWTGLDAGYCIVRKRFRFETTKWLRYGAIRFMVQRKYSNYNHNNFQTGLRMEEYPEWQSRCVHRRICAAHLIGKWTAVARENKNEKGICLYGSFFVLYSQPKDISWNVLILGCTPAGFIPWKWLKSFISVYSQGVKFKIFFKK